MQKDMQRCIRCNGRKQMYKLNNTYTHANFGGALVNCPMCAGKGIIKTLDAFLAEQESKTPTKRGRKHAEKGRASNN